MASIKRLQKAKVNDNTITKAKYECAEIIQHQKIEIAVDHEVKIRNKIKRKQEGKNG